MNSNSRVAVVDDNKLSAHNLGVKLKFIGEHGDIFRTDEWNQLDAARKAEDYFVVVIGSLAREPALQVMQDMEAQGLELPVIVASEEDLGKDFAEQLSATLQSRLIAVHGRPVHHEKLTTSLSQARHLHGLPDQHPESVIISETGTAMFRSLTGRSELIQDLRDTINQLEGKTISVLISGESGTGKEIVARNLHYVSGRHGVAAFVPVNCASVAPELFTAELFGVEKGYQGAIEDRPGYFEKAHGGTLFLDMVDELPASIQARLLRFLETQQFERLGSQETRQADVRVIAATHVDLEAKVKAGEFRRDLFFRINILPVVVPPLRKRPEDIPELIRELVSRLQGEKRQPVSFNSAAVLSLQRHDWPGNVRELANLVERMCVLHGNQIVGVSDLPRSYQYVSEEEFDTIEIAGSGNGKVVPFSGTEGRMGVPGASTDAKVQVSLGINEELGEEQLQAYLHSFEQELMAVALEDCAGIEEMAAERLGMDEKVFRSRREQLGI